MNPTTLGIVFGILSLLGFGIIRIAQRKLIDAIGVYSALFYTYVVEFLTLLLLFSLTGSSFTGFNISTLLFVVIFGIFGALGIGTLFRAISIGSVSVISAVVQTFVIITVFLSMIFLKEQPTSLQFFGIAVTIIGALLVSFHWHDLRSLRFTKFVPGLPYALFTVIAWGVIYVVVKPVVDDVGSITATLLTEGMVSFFILLPAIKTKPKPLASSSIKYMLASGIILALSVFGYNKGIELAPVSLLAPIVAAAPIVTGILARIFLKEHLDISQYLGIVVAVVGVVLISL